MIMMEKLSKSEALGKKIYYPPSGRERMSFAIAMLGEQRPIMAWRGGLLKVGDWDIGSEELEQIGYQSAMALLGECLFSDGQIIDESAIVLARAAISQIMVFEWDATLTDSHGAYKITFSHDGYFRVKTQSASDQLWVDQVLLAGRR